MKNATYLAILLFIIGTGHVLNNSSEDRLPGDTQTITASVNKATSATPASAQERLTALGTEAVVRPNIKITPEVVFPGEPFVVEFSEIHATSTVKKVVFENAALNVFEDDGQIKALAATALEHASGTFAVTAELIDGTLLTGKIVIKTRPKIEAPVGVPEKLGGNTPQSVQKLVTTLATEAEVLRNVRSSSQKLWNGDFIYPLQNPIVTDDYGYSRQTGSYTIAHKGTDFRAAEGTPVYAMNSGVVRLVREFRNYGNTIIIDHGQGLLTLYLHLSEFAVQQGDTVQKGDIIGKSGQTGYANGAHLHLSIKLNTVSIDPIKFLELL